MTPEELAMSDDELAEKYVKFVPAVARKFCYIRSMMDEAESVCLVALFTAVSKRPRDETIPFINWFCVIARTRVFSMIRSEFRHWGRTRRLSVRFRESDDGGIGAVDDDDAFDALVRRTHLYRAALRNHFKFGLSQRGSFPSRMSKATISKRFTYAKDAIRVSLEMDRRTAE